MFKANLYVFVLLSVVLSSVSFAKVAKVAKGPSEYVPVGSYDDYETEVLNLEPRISEVVTESKTPTQQGEAQLPAPLPTNNDLIEYRDRLDSIIEDVTWGRNADSGLSCYKTTTPCNDDDLAQAQAALDQCYLDRAEEIKNEDPLTTLLEIGVAHCYPLSVERDTVMNYVQLEKDPSFNQDQLETLVQPVEVSDGWKNEDYARVFTEAMKQVDSLNLSLEEKLYQLNELFYALSHGVGAFGLLSVDAQIEYYSTARFASSYKAEVRDEILPHYLLQKNQLVSAHDHYLTKFKAQSQAQ